MTPDASPPSTHRVTRLLLAWSGGDTAVPEELMSAVYDELRHLARGYLRRERGAHTLQPTALVHEAYLRLVDHARTDWQSRAHFYGVAARLMRRVLVEHARRQTAAKRGRRAEVLPLEAAGEVLSPGRVDFERLDGALQSLARIGPRQSEVVELKFFGGLTTLEIGEVLQVSERTVANDWQFARLWLQREMNADGNPADPARS